MSPHEDWASEHEVLNELRDEVRQLKQRVDALEHHTQPVALAADAHWEAGPAFALPNAIPVAGKAVLGLAGAYLLRALAETEAIPRLLVVVLAIAYAAAWLVLSERTREEALTAGTYGVTSALILAPLLWEATTRFGVLSPAATATILVAFTALCFALALPGHQHAVLAVTTLSSVTVAFALMIRTGELAVFSAALLALAAIIEGCSLFGRGRGLRVPAAIAADLALLLMIYLMTRAGGLPGTYKALSPWLAMALLVVLFAVYAASAAWRSAILQRSIPVFDALQCAVAFAIAAVGTLQLFPRSELAVGAGSLAGALACYGAAFLVFTESGSRNHKVYASWGAVLAILAIVLILPEPWLAVGCGVAAATAALATARTSSRTLEIHSAVYLLAAVAMPGAFEIAANAFAGPTLRPATATLWMVTAAAVGCYTVSWFRQEGSSVWLSLLCAAIGTVCLGALVLLVALPVAASRPGPALLASARTLVICVTALMLGFVGSRQGHRELVWLSYAAIGAGTVKLLYEDFRQGQQAALALSLLFYGALLILMPKFNTGRRASSQP